jgi:hypothetical protein
LNEFAVLFSIDLKSFTYIGYRSVDEFLYNVSYTYRLYKNINTILQLVYKDKNTKQVDEFIKNTQNIFKEITKSERTEELFPGLNFDRRGYDPYSRLFRFVK